MELQREKERRGEREREREVSTVKESNSLKQSRRRAWAVFCVNRDAIKSDSMNKIKSIVLRSNR